MLYTMQTFHVKTTGKISHGFSTKHRKNNNKNNKHTENVNFAKEFCVCCDKEPRCGL